MTLKYAFMSFSTPELSLGEMLQLAKRLGCDGIEPRVESDHRHGIELDLSQAQRREARQKAANAGIDLCCIATSCELAAPATQAKHIDDARRYIDLAADVGASRIRVFGGHFPDDVSRAQAIDSLVSGLRAVAPQAASRGVRVCLETHDSWTHPEIVARVMREVDHSAVGVTFDLWHPTRTSGVPLEQAFRTLQPWIHHCHFHDGLVRLDQVTWRSIGTGELDLVGLVRLLRQSGYDGYLSGEWMDWDPGDVHLPREMGAIRQIERDVERVESLS
jgi:sugar phosphate isomerase/epimerase